MRYPKIQFFLLFTTFCMENAHGQINGDTVILNREAEVQIVFPASPLSFSTVPVNTQYRIWDTKNSIYMMADAEDSTPVNLHVSEGGRNHRFILLFKKNISNSEAKLYYDFATVRKLEQHIRKMDRTLFTQPVSAGIAVSGNTKATKKAPEGSSDSLYHSLLAQGQRNFDRQNYEEASLSFNKAHTLRPKEKIPLQKLKEVEDRVAGREKAKQEENNRKYVDLIAEARFYMESRKYAEAGEIYKRVLELRPGDLFATRQLQKISRLPREVETTQTDTLINPGAIEEKKIAETQQLLKNGNYSAVRAADSSLYKRQIPQRPNIEPKSLLENDSTASPADVKKQYNLAISAAKSSYIKGDLQQAKVLYEEAARLQPAQQEPANQLKIITARLEEMAREEAINNEYERIITVADSQSIAKAFEAALITYRQASVVKPMESYPKRQIKYLQSELSRIEKRKKEEEELRYNDALTKADKAVAEKKYEEAKNFYTEALDIHPENEYAKRRMEIIVYQLEKVRLEKLAQDTVKPAPPVKKSRRKRAS